MWLPSGNFTVRYWKWPFSSWIFPLNMVIFHSFLYVYQRVKSLLDIAIQFPPFLRWCEIPPPKKLPSITMTTLAEVGDWITIFSNLKNCDSQGQSGLLRKPQIHKGKIRGQMFNFPTFVAMICLWWAGGQLWMWLSSAIKIISNRQTHVFPDVSWLECMEC